MSERKYNIGDKVKIQTVNDNKLGFYFFRTEKELDLVNKE